MILSRTHGLKWQKESKIKTQRNVRSGKKKVFIMQSIEFGTLVGWDTSYLVPTISSNVGENHVTGRGKKKRREWETELMMSQQRSSLIIHAGKMINLSKQRRPSSCHREADWPQPQWTTAASPVTSYKSVVTAGHFPVWLPASMNKVFLLFFPPPLLLRVCLLLWNFSSLVDQRTSWNVI